MNPRPINDQDGYMVVHMSTVRRVGAGLVLQRDRLRPEPELSKGGEVNDNGPTISNGPTVFFVVKIVSEAVTVDILILLTIDHGHTADNTRDSMVLICPQGDSHGSPVTALL